MQNTATTPDYDAIKTKQRATWAAGDYSRIGSTLQLVGEELAEAMAMTPGSRALDVAAGNGNITLAMARRGCEVTSSDYVAELLQRCEARAAAEGLPITFQVADAEALPFADGEFDAVASTFGVMFTPNQAQSARELLRVCRPGGTIGLANWTPDSFIGRLFGVIGKHVPPPAGVQSPARWGNRTWLAEQFGAASSEIAITPKAFRFRYRSANEFLTIFRDYYGPMQKALLAVQPANREELEHDILALARELDTATDGTMCVPGDYLEVRITKAG